MFTHIGKGEYDVSLSGNMRAIELICGHFDKITHQKAIGDFINSIDFDNINTGFNFENLKVESIIDIETINSSGLTKYELANLIDICEQYPNETIFYKISMEYSTFIPKNQLKAFITDYIIQHFDE